jgi:hypothetical protein
MQTFPIATFLDGEGTDTTATSIFLPVSMMWIVQKTSQNVLTEEKSVYNKLCFKDNFEDHKMAVHNFAAVAVPCSLLIAATRTFTAPRSLLNRM